MVRYCCYYCYFYIPSEFFINFLTRAQASSGSASSSVSGYVHLSRRTSNTYGTCGLDYYFIFRHLNWKAPRIREISPFVHTTKPYHCHRSYFITISPPSNEGLIGIYKKITPALFRFHAARTGIKSQTFEFKYLNDNFFKF